MRVTPAGQYFEAEPTAPSQPAVGAPRPARPLAHARAPTAACSRPTRVDPGTKYLLLESPPPAGHAARFSTSAAATGRSPCTLAGRAPDATVWAVDVNERAAGAVPRRTPTAPGSTTCRAIARPTRCPTTSVVDLPLVEPAHPHRQGRAPRAAARAGSRGSAPAGTAVLVVQKHLGADSLQRWLERRGLDGRPRLGSRGRLPAARR